MTSRTGWLYHVPPLRMPRMHAGRHQDVAAAVVLGTVWLFIATLAAGLWLYETAAWCVVWFYYGIGRWIYRHNIIGRAVTALWPRRRHRAPTSVL